MNSSLELISPAFFSLVATVPTESPLSTSMVAVRGALFRAHTSLTASQPIPASRNEATMTPAR